MLKKTTMNTMPKSFNEKGLAPVLMIVAAVVAVAALGGGYLFLSKSGKAPSLPSIGQVALNPNCEYKDPDLCKYINNWFQLKDYSVKTITTDKSGKKSESVMTNQGEDKYQMIMIEDGKENYNMISIGDTTYTKDYSDNKWWKQKAAKETEELKDQFESDFVPDASPEAKSEENKLKYNSLGKEACGDKQCFKYEIVNPSGRTGTKEYVWFDDKEYKTRRTLSEGDGVTSESIYTYDNINISEPSPTKDASPDQVIMPGGGSFEPSAEDKKMIEDAQKESQKMMEEYSQENTEPSSDYSE